VLALHPGHAGARAAVDALTRNEDTLERAATVLERLYTAEGGHDAVATLYERRLGGRGGDSETRQQWYARLAEVHEVARGDLGAGFAVWARALAEAPDRADVQGQLERRASRGNWGAGRDLRQHLRRGRRRPRAPVRGQLGSCADAVGDLDRAAQRYRRALDVASDERPVLVALDRIYGRAAKFADLADILAREAEAAGDAAEQAELWFRLGDVREQNLGDVAAAVGAYRECWAPR
jgi:tetratricopeptide (TPR) repeat protein